MYKECGMEHNKCPLLKNDSSTNDKGGGKGCYCQVITEKRKLVVIVSIFVE
jgi:hypothetical protein